MQLSPIDRLYARFPIIVRDSSGAVVTPAAIDVCLLPYRATPSGSTIWTPSTYAAGVVTVLLAGPAADPTSALAVSAAGARLWVRITDNPEVQAIPVDSITVG